MMKDTCLLIEINGILAPIQGADSGDIIIPGVAPFGLTPGCTRIAPSGLITTDKRVLKYNAEDIITINPIDFVREMEEIA